MQEPPQVFGKVGVLGGMGVEATLELMKRVHAATHAEDDQDHVPMFVDMNPQVPSRIRFIVEGDGPDPGPVLAEMAKRLQDAGATALAMPCNTAHLFARQIEAAVDIPLLNMPQRACDEVAAGLAKGDLVGILASPATNSTGLFSDMLARSGIRSCYPQNEDDVLASIRRIKKGGATGADIAVLERESATLAERGASSVIIGCSEFSLISRRFRSPVPVCDTLDALVRAIIDFSGARARQSAVV
jgi:aspartate racemase